MNVAVFGLSQAAQIITNVIENFYNPWLKNRGAEPLNVTALVARGGVAPDFGRVGNLAIINEVQFSALYAKKVINKIIFPREDMANSWLLKLISLGVKAEDFYLTCRLSNNISPLNFLEPYLSAKFLPQLEFHAADNCNLNCRGCSHFSGLVTKPTFPSLTKFEKDLNRLHELIDDIDRLYILGGEPLLNPEVNEYVKLCRKIYPHSKLKLVTNGILLPKMSDEFFQTIRTNNASIEVSSYPPMHSKIPQLEKFLNEKQVDFIVRKYAEKFSIKHTLAPHNKQSEIFFRCSRANCHFLYDGKIAACCFPFMVKYFNEYFNQNWTADGITDLYETDLTAEKIKSRLMTPFELCRHCTDHVMIDWGAISYPSPITDWTNDHLIGNNV